jgi:hypothetical protein
MAFFKKGQPPKKSGIGVNQLMLENLAPTLFVILSQKP